MVAPGQPITAAANKGTPGNLARRSGRRWVFVGIGASAIALQASSLLGQPDPRSQLEFSSYFGGTGADTVTAVRVDANGNMYLAGSTRSPDLTTRGTLFPPPAATGTATGFLTKLRPDRSIVYSTFLERPVVALAIDPAGNAVVVDHLPAGSKFTGPIDDVVVSKIDANGTTVVYSVRLGGSRLDRAAAIAADQTGAVVVTGQTNSPDFPLLNALQPTVHATGAGWGPGSAFITKLDAQGRLVFSTGWGGSGEDAGTGVAIDRSLDIVVSGSTASIDFVTTPHAFQRTLASAGCSGGRLPCGDAFISRLSPDGQSIRFSTLFGGSSGETVQALAIDQLGRPHIAGSTASPDLPLRRALQTTCDSAQAVNGCSSYVAKLSPDGSSLEYSTLFGSKAYYVFGLGQTIDGLEIDSDGSLIVVGTTQGNDLPLVRAFQLLNGAGPLFKSSDDGVTWSPSSQGITGTGVWFISSAGRRSPLYAASMGHVFRSEDQGRSWRGPRPGERPDIGTYFAVDALTPSTLYSVGFGGFQKSTDGGESWSQVALDEREFSAVAVAPSLPANVYVSARRGVFHSPNSGVTWSLIYDANPGDSFSRPYVQNLAVDPRNADAVYALFSDGSLTRREGGRQWTPIGSVACPVNQLVFAADSSSTMYARACGKVWKSVDEGRSWREVGSADRTAAWITVDPSMPHVVYVASAHNGVYRSIDRGETWSLIRAPLDQDIRSVLVDPSSPGTIYIGATGASNAFVARFDSSGTLTLSTYLGGLNATAARVAVDRNRAIVVAGTAGREFPLVRPIQRTYGGAGDAFLASIVPNEERRTKN